MRSVRRTSRWYDTYEVNSVNVEGPFVGEDQFAVRYDFETTAKADGTKMRMTEMALYTVKDGKIVREQFYYHAPGA